MNLSSLQMQQQAWMARNFPNQTATQSLLGVVEEVGELSHAHLKAEQGIRGTEAEHHAAKVDAVADLIIFLCGYCTLEGIDLDHAVHETWERVRRRDWIADPQRGEPELEARDVWCGSEEPHFEHHYELEGKHFSCQGWGQ